MSKLIDEVFLPIERDVIQRPEVLKENANVPPAPAYLFRIMLLHIDYDKFCEKLFGEAYKAHIEGWVHLNKRNDGSPWVAYCGAFKTIKIAQLGLSAHFVETRRPRHLDSFIAQLLEFASRAATERTGAIGFSGFFDAVGIVAFNDTFLRELESVSPSLAEKYIKQCAEHYVWAINYTNIRIYESLFNNIDHILPPPNAAHARYSALFAKYFYEELYRGDAKGRPFTFPLITFYHNDRQLKLLEEYGISEAFWKVVAYRGNVYFLNHEAVGLSEDDIVAFCCRLISNKKTITELNAKMRMGYSLTPCSGQGVEGIGSLIYATINLARLAWLGRSEEKKFEELLQQYVDLLLDKYLLLLRKRYIALTELGWYKVSEMYISPDWYKYFYVTVATCASAEAVAIMLREPYLWYREFSLDGDYYFEQVVDTYRYILGTIAKCIEEKQREVYEREGEMVAINIEQSPAESSSYRFAKIDWERYPEMRRYIPRAALPTGQEEVFYTSQITPPYCTWRLSIQLELEGKIQPLYTGGVVKHLRFHRPLPIESVKEIVEFCRKVGMVYYRFAPTVTVCLNCGYSAPELFWTCPACGSDNVEQWSAICGYYRPIRNWNPGRVAEFMSSVKAFKVLEPEIKEEFNAKR